MPQLEVRLKFFIKNRDAAEALIRGATLLAEAAGDMPWRDDLREAATLISQAIEGLGLRSCNENDDRPEGK